MTRSAGATAAGSADEGRVDRDAYDAFISYSQRGDRAVARALRNVIQAIGKPWWRVRSLDVFLDATSLSAAPDLWGSIAEKLDRSRYLILLASPEAAASPWVEKEIAHFIGAGGAAPERLLIGLTEGELAWDAAAGDFAWTASTPLPPCLRGRFAREPLWVDLRPFRAEPARATGSDQAFLHAALDLAATIKGVGKADLYSDELRQQRRNLRLATGAAAVVALLAVLAVIGAWIAVERTEMARRQEQEALATGFEQIGDFAFLSPAGLDASDALDSYLKSLAIRRALAEAWPDELQVQKDLAATLARISRVADEPEPFLREAVAVLTALAEAGRLTPEEEGVLASFAARLR